MVKTEQTKATAEISGPKAMTVVEHIHYHKNGTIRAKGQMQGVEPIGYWEWFRKDGTKMRSGTFENGLQVGEWTTYDASGAVYKVTTFKRRTAK